MSSIENNNEIINNSTKSENDIKIIEKNIEDSNTNLNTSEELSNTDFEILDQKYANPDHVFKLIVIGDSSVGKTCLTYRIATGEFPKRDSPTLGFEFFPILIKYKDKILKMEIWDTCGQEAYRSLIKSFYINSSMAIIVYSIDNKKTFENIPEWIRQCRNYCSPKTKLILIGNKNDLEK